MVFLLDSSSYGYRAGTPTGAQPLKLSVGQLPIYELRVMGRNVDVGRIELLELIDVGKEFRRTRSLQWGKYLKREAPTRCFHIQYAHNSLQRYE